MLLRRASARVLRSRVRSVSASGLARLQDVGAGAAVESEQVGIAEAVYIQHVIAGAGEHDRGLTVGVQDVVAVRAQALRRPRC